MTTAYLRAGFWALILALGHSAAPPACAQAPAPVHTADANADTPLPAESGARLDALSAAIAANPGDAAARLARAAIWQDREAWGAALADLNAVLDAAPDSLPALSQRARVNARAGRIAAALDDYTRALDLAPDDTALAAERATLAAERDAARAAAIRFSPDAVMSADFLVVEGAPGAADTLHIVHSATALTAETDALDPAVLARAVAAGALRVIHIFTYTGQDSAIWGNLGLICAGADGFWPVYDRLATAVGQAALAAVDRGERAALDALLAESYAAAGVDIGQLDACARDRGQALRYLADWRQHDQAGAWQGVNLLDHAPAWVLNGRSLDPQALAGRLAAMAPGPSGSAAAAAAGPPAETASVELAPAPSAGDLLATGDLDPPARAADATPAATDPAVVTGPLPDQPPEPAPDTPPDLAPSLETPLDTEVAATGSDGSAPDRPAAVTVARAGAGFPATSRAAQIAPPRPGQAHETGYADPVRGPSPDAAAEPDVPGPDTTAPAADPVATAGQTTASRAARAAPPRPTPVPGAPTATEAGAEPVAIARPALPPGALFPPRPQPVGDLRVPAAQRGVYAPSLADCLAYLGRIDDPARLGAVLPAPNPLDGPALGTILVTSRRAYLFDAEGTDCAIASATGDGTDWRGQFRCATARAPAQTRPLHLAPAAADGSAPRLSARLGGAAAVTLRQCRALGQLGSAFAALWVPQDNGCAISIATDGGRYRFALGAAGELVLRLDPAAARGPGAGPMYEAGPLFGAVDGAVFDGPPGNWDGAHWQLSLGPFDAAAARLAWGMFLDLRTPGGFHARLPLFGSGAAMAILADCTPATP